MRDNPWRFITRGPSGQLTTLRVSVKNRFNFFWAKNAEDCYALLLTLSDAQARLPPFPKVKGVKVAWSQESLQLQLVLSTELNWELFLALCNDIIASTNPCGSEQEAINALVTRLTRWHRFLAKSSSTSLSALEIQGLFGELTFLRDELMKRFNFQLAVAAWHGPQGTPQDFAVGTTLFEVKTHLVESSRTVLISSPEQLWPGDGCAQFLTIVPLVQTQTGGANLTELVREISTELAETSALSEFEDKLERLGYIDLDEYSAVRYIAQKPTYYRIEPGFPSIPSTAIPAGVRDVRFSVHLDYCEPFIAQPNWAHLLESS